MTQRNKSMEERFDEKFPILITDTVAYGKQSELYQDLKSFIKDELATQKEEIMELKGHGTCELDGCGLCGWDDAIDTVLKLLE